MAKSTVSVRRDGYETNVKAEGLVPGDIIILCAEDLVPADARLIQATRLEAPEWAITGQRTSAEKGILQVAPGTPLEMQKSMVNVGTTISSGSALAVVVATGLQTELGRRAAGND